MTKKIIGRTLLVILGLLILWVVINLFDASLVPVDFTKKDLPPARFDKSNGYYRLWTLTEPEGADIMSDEIIIQFRQLFDSTYDNDKTIEAWDFKKHKEKYHPIKKEFDKIGRIEIPTKDYTADWSEYVLSRKKDTRDIQVVFKTMLERYQLLMETEVFEDFTLVRADSPIPNLLAWLHISKVQISIDMLDAIEGNWEQGVGNLLKQLEFSKRSIKGSRVLITNLIGKAVQRMSIRALNSLMNQKDCPPEVFQQILDATPPIEYEEYGSPVPLALESMYLVEHMDSFLDTDYSGILTTFFFQKNSTINMMRRIGKKLLYWEKTPPYQWEEDMMELKPYEKGFFWWVRNPVGKHMYANWKSVNFNAVVMKSFKSKTLYDMLRIAAQLHLNYTPDKPIQEILNGLEAYKSADPCSGKPYTWDDDKQIIYSIGTDRKDDKGVEQKHDLTGDFVLPVILYVK